MRFLTHLIPGLLLSCGLATASAPTPQDLYDDTILREVRIDFMDADWWQKLKQNWPNGPDILADLTIDSVIYPGVGVRIKGNSSYFFLPPGSQKVSLNVSVDFTDPLLRVYGMKT
jgi:spore coat protein CotH